MEAWATANPMPLVNPQKRTTKGHGRATSTGRITTVHWMPKRCPITMRLLLVIQLSSAR